MPLFKQKMLCAGPESKQNLLPPEQLQNSHSEDLDLKLMPMQIKLPNRMHSKDPELKPISPPKLLSKKEAGLILNSNKKKI